MLNMLCFTHIYQTGSRGNPRSFDQPSQGVLRFYSAVSVPCAGDVTWKHMRHSGGFSSKDQSYTTIISWAIGINSCMIFWTGEKKYGSKIMCLFCSFLVNLRSSKGQHVIDVSKDTTSYLLWWSHRTFCVGTPSAVGMFLETLQQSKGITEEQESDE